VAVLPGAVVVATEWGLRGDFFAFGGSCLWAFLETGFCIACVRYSIRSHCVPDIQYSFCVVFCVTIPHLLVFEIPTFLVMHAMEFRNISFGYMEWSFGHFGIGLDIVLAST
jgi:hypothetical protein